MKNAYKILAALAVVGLLGIIGAIYFSAPVPLPPMEVTFPTDGLPHSITVISNNRFELDSPSVLHHDKEVYSWIVGPVYDVVPVLRKYDEKDLQMVFGYDNITWFNRKLPKNTVVKLFRDSEMKGFVGFTDWQQDPPVIKINGDVEISANDAEMTLMHEEVHLYLHVLNPEYTGGHGPEFEHEMKLLALEGAFSSMW